MPPQKRFFSLADTHKRHTHTHTHTVTCQFNFLIKHAFNFKSARRGQSTPRAPHPLYSTSLTPYGTARLPKTAAWQRDDDDDDTESSYHPRSPFVCISHLAPLPGPTPLPPAAKGVGVR